LPQTGGRDHIADHRLGIGVNRGGIDQTAAAGHQRLYTAAAFCWVAWSLALNT
jgi:hypothetical protein